MTRIVELIVVAIVSLLGGFFLTSKKITSSGKTSQATKDQLDEFGKKIASKTKEAEEVIKHNDDTFEKNTDYIDSPVAPLVDTVDTANKLWSDRNSSKTL